MSLRIRFLRDPGEVLVATIERLSDGLGWDGTAFSAVGTKTAAIPLKASPAPWANRYEAIVATVGWADGNYAVHIHHIVAGIPAPPFAILAASLFNGDDAPPPPVVVSISGNAVKAL